MKRTILQYGLQRTGTNFVETALKKSYRIKLVNQGHVRSAIDHKHVRLYDEKDVIPEPKYLNALQVPDLAVFEMLLPMIPDYYVIVSKDPYSWYLSYIRWAKKQLWIPPAHNYIEEYNLFYSKWLSLSKDSDRFVFVRYVDMLVDYDRMLLELGRRMDLAPRISNRLRFGRISKVSESERFTSDRKKYYVDQEYMSEFTQTQLEELNSKIDTDTVQQLGYRVEAT